MKSRNTNRRDFLKASAGTASTLALAGAAHVHAQGSSVLKVGLVGCGGRGTGAADQALNADREVVLWAMGDAFKTPIDRGLEQLRGRANIREKISVTPDRQFVGLNAYQQVIDSGVDVVLLATPPGFRPLHLKAAVAANKHCFVEKPVATDAPGLRSVMASCEEARRRNLSIVSGLCYRYDPRQTRDLPMGRIHDGNHRPHRRSAHHLQHRQWFRGCTAARLERHGMVNPAQLAVTSPGCQRRFQRRSSMSIASTRWPGRWATSIP